MEEFIHRFKGYGRVPSSCKVNMLTDKNKTHICFTDISDGTSVTNASEQLATEIVNKFKLMPKDCVFYETYNDYDFGNLFKIDYVWELNDKGWIASIPEWEECESPWVDLSF